MSEHIEFRITLHLSDFYTDHRRVARIFVKKDHEIIGDLQNRISEIFNIKVGDFYLKSDVGEYLPESEDVRVLDKDEIVWVCKKSDNASQISDEVKSIKTKKHKKNKNVVEEKEVEPTKHKKKKRKSEKVEEVVELNSTDEEIVVPKKKSKKAKNIENETENNGETLGQHTNAYLKNSKRPVVPKLNEENTKQIEEIKNRVNSFIQSKKNSNSLQNTVKSTSFLQPPIDLQKLDKKYDCKGNVKDYTKSNPVPTNTHEYLSSKKINIVRIDIIRNDNATVSNGFVKSEVDKIERKVSSGSNTTDDNETFNCQSNDNSCQSNDSNCQNNASCQNISEICQNNVESCQNSIESCQNSVESCQNETNYETPQNSFINDLDTETNNFSVPRQPKSKKNITGVAHILQNLKMSDSTTINDSDDSSTTVTKRKRKRVRTRKCKKGDTPTVKPLAAVRKFVVAKPTMHIKFEEEEEHLKVEEEVKNTEEIKEIEGANVENIESSVLGYVFDEEKIRNAVEMKDISPNVGDTIVFKILRITEKYTPEMSDFVVGTVKNISDDKKIVSLEILYGYDQLSNPNGKFSIGIEGAHENQKIRDFFWLELHEPRLLALKCQN